MTFETVTRTTLRSLIADAMGDNLASGTATAGGATTITDSVELAANSADLFKGAWVFINAGTGIGQERYVSASTTGGQLTVPAWTTQPSTDSVYEVHRRKRVAEYNRAIDAALRSTRLMHLNGKVDESTTLDTDYEYTLPAGFHTIHRISMIEDATDDALRRVLEPWEWELIAGDPPGSLRLKCAPIDGYLLRIEGMAYPTVPTADTSAIKVNVQPLVAFAASQLLRSMNDSRWQAEWAISREVARDMNIVYPANSVIVEPN